MVIGLRRMKMRESNKAKVWWEITIASKGFTVDCWNINLILELCPQYYRRDNSYIQIVSVFALFL